MPQCNGCGADSPRTTTTFDKHGAVLKGNSHCSICHPEQHADPFEDPSDRKLWLEADAKPYLYKQIGDQLIAKDELLADIESAMFQDPDAEVIASNQERKRRERRTKALTADEIEQTERRWRPIIAAGKAEEQAADTEMEAQMECAFEKYAREQHDSRIQ